MAAMEEVIGTGEKIGRPARIDNWGPTIGESLSNAKLGRGEEEWLPGLLLEDGRVRSQEEGYEWSKELPEPQEVLPEGSEFGLNL